MLSKQILAVAFCAVATVSSGALAQVRPVEPAAQPGFYGGVALRDEGRDASGINLCHIASTWGRFASPVSDDAARRALVFGGYRWANDVAVEGAISTADRYALQPFDATVRRGVGLSLASTPDIASRTWNADVYTTWSLRKSFSLYGRLGYAQSEAVPGYALAALAPSEPRRLRDGMNYGVGLRSDVTPALGLRLEYARFAGEAVTGPLPDSDQVQFGMQFRF